MQRTRVLGGVAAAAFLSSIPSGADQSAWAADLSVPRDYTIEDHQPQPQPRRNLYVRGDVGIGRFSPGDFSQENLADNGGSFIQSSIDDTVYIGAGIGWQVSPRLRFDFTGEYRSSATVKAMDNLSADLIAPDGTLQANTVYDGRLTSFVGLINGYWDLFHARGFTPYIGAGVGIAYNKLSDFTTASAATFVDGATGAVTTEFSNGTSKSHDETSFAWALMAGTSYDLSPNAKLDIGYRYLNLGSGTAASTDLLECTCGTVGDRLEIEDIDAHEIRIGVRWALGSGYADSALLK